MLLCGFERSPLGRLESPHVSHLGDAFLLITLDFGSLQIGAIWKPRIGSFFEQSARSVSEWTWRRVIRALFAWPPCRQRTEGTARISSIIIYTFNYNSRLSFIIDLKRDF